MTARSRNLLGAGWALCPIAALGCASPEDVTPQRRCQTHDVPVAIAADATTLHTIRGELCRPEGAALRTVQVLVHGATLDRRYWDPEGQPESYSYVAHMTRAGYATFSLDRLGSGESDRPPSAEVTVDAHIHALHELVGQLRTGLVGGVSFERVVTVGHSLGAIVTAIEAGIHRDVDGVILSGFSHEPASGAYEEFGAALDQAATEPAFAGLDEGYFTTRPGSRAALFFSPSASAALIAYDESTKGVVTAGELSSSTPDRSTDIIVPVLVAAGSDDPFSCGGGGCASSSRLEQQEAVFFSSSPSVEATVVPASGHVLNLHESAPVWFMAAKAWTDRHVGASGELRN